MSPTPPPTSPSTTPDAGGTPTVGASRGRVPRSAAVRIAVVLLVLAAGPIAPPGARTVLLVTLVYGLFAVAYDLLLGYSDQPSLGQGLFFGLGAYAFVLPILDHGFGLLTSLLVAFVVGGLVAFLLGLAAVRLSEAFHVIVTALFSSVAYLLANTLTPVTGGSGGRSVTIPVIDLGVVTIDPYSPLGTYAIVAVVVVVLYLAVDRLARSPIGQTFVAIRENPKRAANVGINVHRYKLLAFVLSGAITAVAGALYAIVLRFSSAEFFAFIWSVLPFVWVLVGGMGTIIGGLIGAAIFAVFQFYVAQLWTHYLIVLGVALLVLLRWSPKGIVGVFRSRWGRPASDEEGS